MQARAVSAGLVAIASLSLTTGSRAQAPIVVRPEHRVTVSFPDGSLAQPTTGRLILWLIRDDAVDLAEDDPADGPFLDNPQPMLGVTLRGVMPRSLIRIPGPDAPEIDLYGKLGPGSYRVQATFDWQRVAGDWHREPGNLYSGVARATIDGEAGSRLDLALDLEHVVPPVARPETPGVDWFSVRSELLSDYRLRDIELRAGVLPPPIIEEGRRYPAVYYVPGFGGDDRSAAFLARLMDSDDAGPMARIHEQAFIFVLNPDSPNGHTLFADSAVNGPWGRALTQELIPALELAYPLITDPEARLVRGHSSGGWSTVWLCLMYPDVFGHGFASSPDPIDFRAFQESSIYGPNFYLDAHGSLLASNTRDGQSILTIAQENLIEETIGPMNTSGQQWDSWLAVFGPCTARGLPADLFDPFTGEIDRRVARHFEPYDIGARLRAEPGRLAPIFRDRLRILVGDEDEWSLHKAVALVKDDLESLGYDTSGDGSISIAPGYDHGSIHGSPEMAQLYEAMVDIVQTASTLGEPQ